LELTENLETCKPPLLAAVFESGNQLHQRPSNARQKTGKRQAIPVKFSIILLFALGTSATITAYSYMLRRIQPGIGQRILLSDLGLTMFGGMSLHRPRNLLEVAK